MIDKALLTGAFEKMGPERVTQMLRAFGPDGRWDEYCQCALGFAAGFGNRTDEERWDAMAAEGFSGEALRFLAHRLGLAVAEAEYIETVHMRGTWPYYKENRDYRVEAAELVALANEWLENRPASIRVVEAVGITTEAARRAKEEEQ